jgi:Zn-dependent M28 family amino/carboxypeptidase
MTEPDSALAAFRADPGELARHVRALSGDFYPRSYDQPRRLNAAARYIADEMRKLGATVSLQPVMVEGERYDNVIARFGSAPRPGSAGLIVIGAHYDSHGHAALGGRDPRGYSPESHTPGADDNASGVAGLIELARAFAQRPPERPVELVAYTLEEPPNFRTPNMGSVWHASALARSDQSVQLVVSLEMIGFFSDAPGSQRYPLPGLRWVYGDRGDFIAIVARFGDPAIVRRAKGLMRGATELPVQSINAPAWVPGVDLSDHRSYWAHDLPAIMVTDTAFYRNPNYHGPGDRPETLDYMRMAQVVTAVESLARRF